MSGAPAIVRSPREAWLAERRNHIGASDVAAILGVDPRRGALAVYASKVSDAADPDETRWMKFGRRIEGAIADWYSEDTGRPALDLGAFEIQRHPDAPFLGATLDRMTGGSDAHPDPFGRAVVGAATTPHCGPLEAKAVAGFKAKEWREDPPLHYQVQLQAQLACTGASWGSLVALIGGIALAWRDLERDDAFLAVALPKLEAFWLRVQRREPPEADALPGTSEAIRRLWSKADGETIPLDHAALQLVTSWEAAKVRRDSAEETKDEAENRLRTLLGPASYGSLPDGSVLTLKEQHRKSYTVQPADFRVLRRWFPKLPRR